ncbi:MAG TPA: MarR family transcriptional regulator [Puia sp.]|nr:MarR family transcriptional regulator [Puia sp.]
MKNQVMAGPTTRDMEVAAALRTGVHRLVKLLRRETRNDAQLSLTERSTMGLLYPDLRLAPSEIARMEKVTTQSMSQVINHLVELDYITRTPSGDDKRMVLLSLTAAGRQDVEQRRRDKQEWLANALHERISPAEKELLMEALHLLTKLVDG